VAREPSLFASHGRALRERAALLPSIAHPNFRGELKRWVAGTRHYLL